MTTVILDNIPETRQAEYHIRNQENPLFFVSKYKEINNLISRSIKKNISISVSLIGSITLIPTALFLEVAMQESIRLLIEIPGGNFLLILLILASMFLWVIGMGYIIYFVSHGLFYPLKYTINRISNGITDLYNTIEINISSVQSIDEILYKTDSIKRLFSLLRIYRGVIYYINRSHYTKFGEVLEQTIGWVSSILLDLRSDLATRLTEQQQILEGAKTEVEKNITGTPELLAVSETQKLRLDRQIEQFEELQRVLVKV